MSRLAATFDRIRTARNGPGLVTYVTAGDPDLPRTEGILRALDRAGADVLEVGVPFSDPLADGPVIQRATERALASGTTLAGVLDDEPQRAQHVFIRHSPFGVPSVSRPRASGRSGRTIRASRDYRPNRIVAGTVRTDSFGVILCQGANRY